MGTNGSHLTRLQGGKSSRRPVVGHLPSTPQGLLQEQLSEQGFGQGREGWATTVRSVLAKALKGAECDRDMR